MGIFIPLAVASLLLAAGLGYMRRKRLVVALRFGCEPAQVLEATDAAAVLWLFIVAVILLS